MTFTFLLFLTILFTICFGISASKFPRYYKLMAIPSILLYVLTYGFREGWAVDYYTYDSLFNGLSKTGIDQYELLFRYIVLGLRSIFDGSYSLFSLVALTTFLSQLVLYKEHKSIISISIPLFIGLSAYQASNLTRYFLAISLVYVGIYYLWKRNIQYTFIIFITSILIHYGASILVLLILLLFYVNVFKNKWINLLIFTLISILNIGSLHEQFVQPVFNLLNLIDLGSNQLAKYQDQTVVQDYILGQRDEMNISPLFTMSTILFGYLYIIWGTKLCKYLHNEYVSFIYYLSLLGVFLNRLSLGAEILTRIALFFMLLSPFVIGYIIKYRTVIIKVRPIFVVFIFSVMYQIYFSLKPLYNDFDLLYIWE